MGQVPRLNLPAHASGEKTLCRTASEFRKSTVVPTRTGRTCGEKTRFGALAMALWLDLLEHEEVAQA